MAGSYGAAFFLATPSKKDWLCTHDLIHCGIGAWPDPRDDFYVWFFVIIAKQQFAHVSGYEGECGKALELVFEVYCHDFESISLRFIVFQHPAHVFSDLVRFTQGQVVIGLDRFDVPGFYFFGILDEISHNWIYQYDLNVTGHRTGADASQSTGISIPLTSLCPSGMAPYSCIFPIDLCDTNALFQYYEMRMFSHINEFRRSYDLRPLEWSNQFCIICRFLCRDRSQASALASVNIRFLFSRYFLSLHVVQCPRNQFIIRITKKQDWLDPVHLAFDLRIGHGWEGLLDDNHRHCGVGFSLVPGGMNDIVIEVVIGTCADITIPGDRAANEAQGSNMGTASQ
jgi:hypothetical protein